MKMSSVANVLFLMLLPLKGFSPCDPCSLIDDVLSMKDLADGLSLHPPFILCCPKKDSKQSCVKCSVRTYSTPGMFFNEYLINSTVELTRIFFNPK